MPNRLTLTRPGGPCSFIDSAFFMYHLGSKILTRTLSHLHSTDSPVSAPESILLQFVLPSSAIIPIQWTPGEQKIQATATETVCSCQTVELTPGLLVFLSGLWASRDTQIPCPGCAMSKVPCNLSAEKLLPLPTPYHL